MPNFKLLKATGVYTFLGFIPLVSSFVLLPIYTQYLHASDYGIVALGGLTESYLLIFFTFGLPMAFTVFFFQQEKKVKGVESLLRTTLIAIIGNAGMSAIFLAFFGDWLFFKLWDGNLPFEEFGWFVFGSSVFLALNQILFQYYRIKENLRAVVIITMVPFILSTAGGVTGVIFLGLGAYGSIVWKSIGTIIGSLPLYIYIFYRIGFQIERGLLKELYSFAYPFVLIFFLTNISETVDKFLLNKYFDLETLGLYNFASVVVTPVAILIQSYWNSVTPTMFRIIAEDNTKKNELLSTYFKGTLLITLVAIWGVIIIVEPVIKVLTNSSYHAATYFVPILCVAAVGKAYYNIYTFNATFYKKTRLLPIITVVSFATALIIALGLYELLGIWSILISVVVSKLVQGLAAYLLEKKLGLHFYSILNQIGLVIFSLVILFMNYMFFYKQDVVANWLIHLIEGLLFFSIVIILYRDHIIKTYRHLRAKRVQFIVSSKN